MESRSKGITVDSGGETEAGTVKTAQMYVEGYKASRISLIYWQVETGISSIKQSKKCFAALENT